MATVGRRHGCREETTGGPISPLGPRDLRRRPLSPEQRAANSSAAITHDRALPNRWRSAYTCVHCGALQAVTFCQPNGERMKLCAFCERPNVIVFVDGCTEHAYCCGMAS